MYTKKKDGENSLQAAIGDCIGSSYFCFLNNYFSSSSYRLQNKMTHKSEAHFPVTGNGKKRGRLYYVQNMNKYPKDRVKLQTGPRAPGRSLNKLRNKIMVALIPVHSLFSVRVSNVSKSGSVLMGENLLKEKSSPFTVSSSVTLRRDGQRNGCRKV